MLARRAEHDQLGAARAARQLGQRRAPGLAQIRRGVVHVQAHVAPDHVLVELLRVALHGLEGLLGMRPGEGQRGAQRIRQGAVHGGPQVEAREQPAERHRAAGQPLPARAQVLEQRQAVAREGEAPLVDRDAGVGLAVLERRQDAVEAHVAHGARREELGVQGAQQQRRRGALAGTEHGARRAAQRGPREQDRPDSEPQRRADRQHAVALRQAQRGREAGLADLERAGGERPVELLDVREPEVELEAGRRHAAGEQPVEQEGVVGAGRQPDAELHGRERPRLIASSRA